MLLRIEPNINVHGEWTMDDAFLAGLYRRMESDGTVAAAFADGSVASPEAFISEMRGGSLLFVVMGNDGNPHAVAWLNNFKEKAANLHFCVFSSLWGRPDLVVIGKWFVQRLIRFHGRTGFMFDVFYGYVPMTNIHALDFSTHVATQTMGKTDIPGIGGLGMLCIFTREEAGGAYENYYQMRD